MIPRENSDLRELSNWRHIPLLNADFKIAWKAIALRIQKFLSYVINSNQMGLMKDGYIGEILD